MNNLKHTVFDFICSVSFCLYFFYIKIPYVLLTHTIAFFMVMYQQHNGRKF